MCKHKSSRTIDTIRKREKADEEEEQILRRESILI
jgi:hypothetical protein